MRILSVSDVEIGFIYSPMILERFQATDLIISCGDLPYYYLEYILTMLNVPLYYVRGNHASRVEFTSEGERSSPWGARNLNQRDRAYPGGAGRKHPLQPGPLPVYAKRILDESFSTGATVNVQ